MGSKAIRENAPSHVVDKLVEGIHTSRIEHLKLATTPEERQKIELNSSKTEAAVKGFVLPLTLGGPSDELERFGLDQDEMLVPMKATG